MTNVYTTDVCIVERISEVAEVRNDELGRLDNWLRIDFIPKRRGLCYKVILNRGQNDYLIGNYHGVLRKRLDGTYRVYLESEDGSYYMFKSTYNTINEVMIYWNIIWFKRQVLVEKTGY